MKTILVLDSSSENCSVALFHESQTFQRTVHSPRQHSQLMLPLIEEVLREAAIEREALDAIGFCRGPGSFTGIRICVSIAQGLAFALDIPVIPISTLHVMAQGLLRQHTISSGRQMLICVDARMSELYCGLFTVIDNQTSQPVLMKEQAEVLCSPEVVDEFVAQLNEAPILAGSGCAYLNVKNVVDTPFSIEPTAADARHLLLPHNELYQPVTAELAEPTYLRDSVAWKKRQRIR